MSVNECEVLDIDAVKTKKGLTDAYLKSDAEIDFAKAGVFAAYCSDVLRSSYRI